MEMFNLTASWQPTKKGLVKTFISKNFVYLHKRNVGILTFISRKGYKIPLKRSFVAKKKWMKISKVIVCHDYSCYNSLFHLRPKIFLKYCKVDGVY